MYTQEHFNFIKDKSQCMGVTELTREFNNKFNTSKTPDAIRSTIRRKGIDRSSSMLRPQYRSFIFSQEQVEFIVVNYAKASTKQLTKLVNEKFDSKFKVSQIRSFVHNHGISSGRTGRFKKGEKPWNTGTKGVVKPNCGNFKKGAIPANIKPIGHERICSKDGYVLIKIEEINPYTGAPTRYKAKHIVVWEMANGKVPKGMIVTFRDLDKTNCELDNLFLISKKVNLYLNQHGYNDLPPSLRPAMLALAELECKRFGLISRDKEIK